MTTYKLTVVDMPTERIVEVLEASLTFHPHWLYVDMEFYYDEKNEDTTAWAEGLFNSIHYRWLRSSIVGTCRYFSRTSERWGVEIYTKSGEKNTIFFMTEKEAKEVEELLITWLTYY
jgi:hypothetical protein